MSVHDYSFVYILCSKRNGTLYVGATTDLVRRVWEHKEGGVSSFTRKYGVTRLVYVEPHASIEDAAARERQLKKWNRAWKLKLIESKNPDWDDLYGQICR